MDKNSPRNKALSYDPDFELIKLFASRHEEKHDIEQFFWNIFEDDDVIACVQAFFGYCFTGKTDLKKCSSQSIFKRNWPHRINIGDIATDEIHALACLGSDNSFFVIGLNNKGGN